MEPHQGECTETYRDIQGTQKVWVLVALVQVLGVVVAWVVVA